MQKKYQVFISSTFSDLKEERRLVTEQILNLGHIPIGMELFHASDDDQWTYIRRRISESDYYIVIVAERYGSVDAEGVSFTEKEYRFALAENVPIAGFLLAEEARRKRPVEHVEHAMRGQIDSFRKLCQQKLIRYWSDSNNLALAVTNSLFSLIAEKPRRGLVPAGEAAPEVTEELARLSKQNSELQKALQEYRDAQQAKTLSEDDKKIVDALRSTLLHEALIAKGAALKTIDGKIPGLTLWDTVRNLYLKSSGAIMPYSLYTLAEGLSGDKLDFSATYKEEAWLGILDALEKLKILNSSREQRMDLRTKHLFNVSVYSFSDYGRWIFNHFSTPLEVIRG